MEGRVPWIIFDADNTLWAVEHLYDQARQAMCAFLGSKGIDAPEAEHFQRERDKQLHITHGYSACRFARSFEDTLYHFLPQPAVADVRHIRQLALNVFEQRAETEERLADVLRQISPAYLLGIITAGERWVQERRLADFHLREVFAAVEIVESKDEIVFRSFCEAHKVDPARSWVVGDSYRSDIQPAKAAGLRAVLLETQNWVEVERHKAGSPPDAVIQRLADLPKVPGLR